MLLGSNTGVHHIKVSSAATMALLCIVTTVTCQSTTMSQDPPTGNQSQDLPPTLVFTIIAGSVLVALTIMFVIFYWWYKENRRLYEERLNLELEQANQVGKDGPVTEPSLYSKDAVKPVISSSIELQDSSRAKQEPTSQDPTNQGQQSTPLRQLTKSSTKGSVGSSPERPLLSRSSTDQDVPTPLSQTNQRLSNASTTPSSVIRKQIVSTGSLQLVREESQTGLDFNAQGSISIPLQASQTNLRLGKPDGIKPPLSNQGPLLQSPNPAYPKENAQVPLYPVVKPTLITAASGMAGSLGRRTGDEFSRTNSSNGLETPQRIASPLSASASSTAQSPRYNGNNFNQWPQASNSSIRPVPTSPTSLPSPAPHHQEMQAEHSRGSATPTAQGTHTAGGTTIDPGNIELSIPGFLEIKNSADYRIGQKIASGGEATIFMADALSPELLRRIDGDRIVIKLLKDVKSSAQDKQEVAFSQEVAVLWFFRNFPNFVKIHGFSFNPKMMILKYYEFGNLRGLTVAKKGTKLPYTKQLGLNLLQDIAAGLSVMHSHGFVHSDIKPHNILLDRDLGRGLTAVLSDFGITQIVERNALLVKEFRVANVKGASVAFTAPEILVAMNERSNSPINPSRLKAGDVYSFAIVLLEVLCRRQPWKR